MVHQIAPSAFKMKKGGVLIFQLSLICTLKAIEVIKKVKKGKKDWVTGLRQLNTLCASAYICIMYMHLKKAGKGMLKIAWWAGEL